MGTWFTGTGEPLAGSPLLYLGRLSGRKAGQEAMVSVLTMVMSNDLQWQYLSVVE